MSTDEAIKRVQQLQGAIGEDLDKFGGYLRCETCGQGRSMKPGDAGRYTAKGWPRCCGYSMRWWTRRQIDAGEMPAPPQFREPAPHNPDDAEDCDACIQSHATCPYHLGVNAGIQMAVRKLTRWAEGDED